MPRACSHPPCPSPAPPPPRAAGAKNVKNEARINEDLDQKSLLRRYERELKKLRTELSERAKGVVDSRKLLEKDELLRRAEEDKLAAIRTLEIRSQEFMREKAEKKRLEERISILQQKILLGGAAGGLGLAGAGGAAGAMGDLKEIPAFRNALKEHQERIRAEYEGRLADLECVGLRARIPAPPARCPFPALFFQPSLPSPFSPPPPPYTHAHTHPPPPLAGRSASPLRRRRRRLTGTSSCCSSSGTL